jgi:hypothetical protein
VGRDRRGRRRSGNEMKKRKREKEKKRKREKEGKRKREKEKKRERDEDEEAIKRRREEEKKIIVAQCSIHFCKNVRLLGNRTDNTNTARTHVLTSL